MRVIAGSARRLLLKTVEGMDTRPTTDRTKETLYHSSPVCATVSLRNLPNEPRVCLKIAF